MDSLKLSNKTSRMLVWVRRPSFFIEPAEQEHDGRALRENLHAQTVEHLGHLGPLWDILGASWPKQDSFTNRVKA